jgi:hypothetical protein
MDETTAKPRVGQEPIGRLGGPGDRSYMPKVMTVSFTISIECAKIFASAKGVVRAYTPADTGQENSGRSRF